MAKRVAFLEVTYDDSVVHGEQPWDFIRECYRLHEMPGVEKVTCGHRQPKGEPPIVPDVMLPD